MERIQFTCTLLTDVILNVKAVSMCDNQTLDFIPGNCFLGIVARELYKEENETTSLLFHSGAVRFGDAHPLLNGMRCLRIPALYYIPKGETEPYYLCNHVENIQLKQCRAGFYAFDDDNKQVIEYTQTKDKNYAIKSAYDSDRLCSARGQMYGYESLPKGVTFAFEVEIDDNAIYLKEEIIVALKGEKGIGRSRTAQYGRVMIEQAQYKEATSTTLDIDEVWVYADGRLIFIDEYGMPTFRPTSADLGLSGTIEWGKSQIRTFQYAPWNAKRQAYDTDRCGIEKGSVFCVKVTEQPTDEKKYVGFYTNEGFGRVLYNPAFLEAEGEKAAYHKFTIKEDGEKPNSDMSAANTPLLKYLNRQQKLNSYDIYQKVNEYVDANKSKFSDKDDEKFASQWGQIRAIAVNGIDYKDIREKIDEYLSHGVCESKWRNSKRKDTLLRFIDENHDRAKKQINQDITKELIVKLASEMQKL